ncbi:hypothetical protein G6F16_013601 [Rhizopus arrhizus]|nr:hypothetical protein G6F22_020059 [Rhizopus arrhizus]KAG0809568.1 hypothetical protein G6F19_013608 [Rhizopus arrhizus]KAG0855973.1 hypothetical protein G6F16_013601 [Rhizopus arrhizus]KAG0861783.1 hypothetical protein G6F15_013697 [Rhizopus arrhizus]KAG0915033.1 hypothetical protein G6F31_021387 [Rhizopus arrhizus]
MSSTRNTRGSKILNAAAGPDSSDLEVTVQNLSHALQAVTARLSALEQLKLDVPTLPCCPYRRSNDYIGT